MFHRANKNLRRKVPVSQNGSDLVPYSETFSFLYCSLCKTLHIYDNNGMEVEG